MATEKRLISYDVLIAHLDSCITQGKGLFKSVCVAIKCFVEQMPTVNAAPVVHGWWREKILVGGFAEEWGYVCSECGCTVSDRSNLSFGRFASINQRLNYCPNCGAKMDGDRNGSLD